MSDSPVGPCVIRLSVFYMIVFSDKWSIKFLSQSNFHWNGKISSSNAFQRHLVCIWGISGTRKGSILYSRLKLDHMKIYEQLLGWRSPLNIPCNIPVAVDESYWFCGTVLYYPLSIGSGIIVSLYYCKKHIFQFVPNSDKRGSIAVLTWASSNMFITWQISPISMGICVLHVAY